MPVGSSFLTVPPAHEQLLTNLYGVYSCFVAKSNSLLFRTECAAQMHCLWRTEHVPIYLSILTIIRKLLVFQILLFIETSDSLTFFEEALTFVLGPKWHIRINGSITNIGDGLLLKMLTEQ